MHLRRAQWPLLVVISLALVGVAATSLARSDKPPGKKIVIKNCAKKKSPVTFDHPAHVKYAKKQKQKCETCHHLVKDKPADKDRCSECHIRKQGDKLGTCKDKSKKKNPFHVQCIGCHKKMKKAKADSKGPTKCKGCHKKK